MPDAGARAATRLSVVVAAWTGPAELERCLASLHAQLDPRVDEIIVARNFVWRLANGARAVPVIDIERIEGTVPQLRAAGLGASSGGVVAFVEDHVSCVEGWRDALLDAYAGQPVSGAGGPVDLGDGGRPLDWAVYFYDYAQYLPPMTSGAVSALSGANMSWTRDFLAQVSAGAGGELFESVLARECIARRSGMRISAGAGVVQRKEQAPASAMSLAFALARGYAAGRVSGAPSPGRLARAAGAFTLLPVVLAARIVANALRSGRHTGRLVLALPWLAVLLCCWSAGEGAGYLTGSGASGRKWR